MATDPDADDADLQRDRPARRAMTINATTGRRLAARSALRQRGTYSVAINRQ